MNRIVVVDDDVNVGFNDLILIRKPGLQTLNNEVEVETDIQEAMT